MLIAKFIPDYSHFCQPEKRVFQLALINAVSLPIVRIAANSILEMVTSMFLRTTILLALICLLPLLANASESSTDLLLSGNDIDLLVGTPTGVVEPLDAKRTVIAEQNRFDYSGFLEDDFQADDGFANLDWSDAEEQPVAEGATEEQVLDLLSETEEIEQSETSEPAKSDANSTDSIETEFKL